MGATGVGENSNKYQVWVSIPDDMEVPEPLVKRTFKGGLYASHSSFQSYTTALEPVYCDVLSLLPTQPLHPFQRISERMDTSR